MSQGLAEHKDELGAPLCPCRHYDDKQAEAEQGFWNCPCVPMRERKVRIKTHMYIPGNGAWVFFHCITSIVQSRPDFMLCQLTMTSSSFRGGAGVPLHVVLDRRQ